MSIPLPFFLPLLPSYSYCSFISQKRHPDKISANHTRLQEDGPSPYFDYFVSKKIVFGSILVCLQLGFCRPGARTDLALACINAQVAKGEVGTGLGRKEEGEGREERKVRLILAIVPAAAIAAAAAAALLIQVDLYMLLLLLPMPCSHAT